MKKIYWYMPFNLFLLAIVLLCLLHAAFSEVKRYSWNGPIIQTTMAPKPNEDNGERLSLK